MQKRVQRMWFVAVVCGAIALPSAAWSCEGPQGGNISVSTDGSKYVVTDIGKAWVRVNFTAWNTNFYLSLAPGQSATPAAPGIFGQNMTGYQTCYAY